MSAPKRAQSNSQMILVVEDDRALQTLFAALLTRHGYEVECVNDGKQALDRLSRNSYAAMLLDLMMPVTNGFDVLRELAGAQAVLHKTIITTGVSERDLAKVDSSSVFAVLRKPFDIDCLMSTIDDCIRKNRRGREHATDEEATDGDDDPVLDDPAGRLESVLPSLRAFLRSGATSERELLLRGEIRQALGQVAGLLAAAATTERRPGCAARWARIARAAAEIAPLPATPARRSH
jgi:DNA-binding NtrC family response regulator